MTIRKFYLLMCVAGTVIPWYFFGAFFVDNGLDIPLFIKSLFANDAAGGFSSDILISLAVFWVWSYSDARTKKIQLWWLVLPAGMLVGLSLALPLYLFLRTPATEV